MNEVDVKEARELINEKKVSVIDVRTPQEFADSHIIGSVLMPLDDIEVWGVSLNKDKTYLLVCRSGGRSGMAYEYLESKGFNVINMKGGMLDWLGNGYAIE